MTAAPSDAAELDAFIDGDPALRELRRKVDHLAAQGAPDPGHDRGHRSRVALWTVRLLDGAFASRVAVAAALLHDAVNPPKDTPERVAASERSAALAGDWLPDLGFDGEEVELIVDAIRDHSFSRGTTPSSDLGKALQDADRLDALGAVGWMRAVACGARLGSSLLDPLDPWARRRPVDDRRFVVDHYFAKLRHLAATLHTDAARAEARRRAAFLETTLSELGREVGVAFEPRPGSAVDGGHGAAASPADRGAPGGDDHGRR